MFMHKQKRVEQVSPKKKGASQKQAFFLSVTCASQGPCAKCRGGIILKNQPPRTKRQIIVIKLFKSILNKPYG